MDISNTILESLVNNDDYVLATLPYLKEEYFEDSYQRVAFRVISNFIEKHQARPDQDIILIDVEKQKGISDDEYESIVELTQSWENKPSDKNLDWLVKESENWCKNRAFYLAVKKATLVLDESKSKDRGSLPEVMQDALGISFDTKIGHDFFEDWEERWHYYTDKQASIPFDIDLLNEMTNGGVKKKTLNVVMGGIHTGKTRFLCHVAASYIAMGLNVVYFTLEMSEDEISKRIDANILGIEMDHFQKMSKAAYGKAIEGARKKTKGDIVVKEFPTASGHAGHFRHVLRELKLKKDFDVDVVMVDYINICASSRAKMGNNTNTFITMIAQELRGLGQEFGIPVWSATQVNRAAFGSSDLDLDDVAEAWGLPAIADWLGAIIVSDELIAINQFIIKQLKSRYSDKNITPKGLINYENTLMRMTNAAQHTSGPPAQSAAPPGNAPSSGSGRKRDFSSFKT